MTVGKMLNGIARIRRRIDDLKGFDPRLILRSAAPEVQALEKAIDSTLESVFGQSSSSYRRFSNAAILDPDRGLGRDALGLQSSLSRGKKSAILMLDQAITFLQEEIESRGEISAPTQSAMSPGAASFSDTIFIGHGRTLVWHQLADFLREDLHLKYHEFNSESTAGVSTTARLQEVLDHSGFAFLVMTAEDGHTDGTTHARENVVHEVGLFQGKLGFKRAIILLEENCARFSNVDGLTYISFPKGNLKPAFEEIRRVLAREHIID